MPLVRISTPAWTVTESPAGICKVEVIIYGLPDLVKTKSEEIKPPMLDEAFTIEILVTDKLKQSRETKIQFLTRLFNIVKIYHSESLS